MIKKYLRRLFEQYGFSIGTIHKNDRSGALHRAWGHVFTNHLRGDYIEFGVYKGDSLIESHKQYVSFVNWINGQLSSPESWRREVAKNFMDQKVGFHGLDTFGGMPKNSEDNATFVEGTYLADYDLVRNKCLESGMSEAALILYRGLFGESALRLRENLGMAAIVNIDCDLYESAKDALSIIEPHIQIGTVILFDDYNAYCADNKKGERRAFREFREKSNLKFEKWFAYQYAGQSFLCVEN